MSKKLQILGLFLSVLAIGGWMFQTFAPSNGTHFAVVRTNDLLYGYAGTQEAISIHEKKKISLESRLDTLRRDIAQNAVALQNENQQGDLANSGESAGLMRQREEFFNYGQKLENQLAEGEQQLIQGILNQVNGFVAEYAEEHGFDLVLGATSEGSVLFADPSLDQTDEILEAINRQYDGE